jgi:hypothetical protein
MRRDPLWRAMWTVGLSLALVVFTGLLLNLIPFGLTRLTWIISLGVVTLIATLAAVVRQAAFQANTRQWSSIRFKLQRWSWVVAGYVAGAVAIAGAAIGLAVASAGWQHSPGFAQLWLVPARSGTAGLPASGGHVALGVRSRYQGAETFQLVLLRGTQPIGTWGFRLDAGQSWQRDVSAPVGQRLTARLTTIGQPSGPQSVAVTSS